jgi:hypothetical protein
VWISNCCKILTSRNDLRYPRSKYMNNPWWSTTIMLFMQYIFFHPLNQLRWARLFQGLRILMRVPSINPMQPWNYGSWVAKTRRSSIMGNWISSTIAELMQDAIKMPSSFIAFLFQFHRNASYLMTFHASYTIWSFANVISGSTWMITQKCGVVPWWTLHDQWWWGPQAMPTPQT